MAIELIDNDHFDGQRNISPSSDSDVRDLAKLVREMQSAINVGGGGGGQTDSVDAQNGCQNTGDDVDAIIEPVYGTVDNTVCEGSDSRLINGDQDYYNWFDDFLGDVIPSTWVDTAENDGTIGIAELDGGQIECLTGTLSGNTSYIRSSNKALKLSHEFVLEAGIRLNETSENHAFLEAYYASDERLNISVYGGNLRCYTQTPSGTDQTADILALDTDFHVYKIVASASEVKYYFDGALVATHSNYLTTNLMYIRCGTVANADATQVTTYIDYVRVYGKRNYW